MMEFRFFSFECVQNRECEKKRGKNNQDDDNNDEDRLKM